MSRYIQKARALSDIGTSGQAEAEPKPPDVGPVPRLWEDLPTPKHPANLRKMLVAQQQIQLMLATAEGQEIDGRRFYGKLHVIVKVENGLGQHVSGFPEFSDRG
jgi:hypothetical protein